MSQLLLEGHVIRPGDTLRAATANHWDGARWSRYGEPENWLVRRITDATLDLYDPVEGVEVDHPLWQLAAGKLRVLTVERPATPVEEWTIADLYAAQRRLKERIYEAPDKDTQEALCARYEAVRGLLDRAIDQIKTI